MANDKSILSTVADYASNYFSPPSQDEELEKQIAEAEANDEPAEVIQALIADSEKKDEVKNNGQTNDERYELEKKKEEEKDKRKFTGSNHVTAEEINDVNEGNMLWTGYDDTDIIPVLQDIYGDEYEITNNSMVANTALLENKKTGVKKEIRMDSSGQITNTPWGGRDPVENTQDIVDQITSFIDEDRAIVDPEAEAEWTKKKEIKNEMHGDDDYFVHEDLSIEIIDKNVEGWNDQPEAYTTEEAFEDTGGRTGGWDAVWRGKGVPNAISSNATADLDKTRSIVNDVKTATALEIRAMRDEKEDGFGTELSIDWERNGEDFYERVFKRLNSNPNNDYLLPEDMFNRLVGGDTGAGFFQEEIRSHNDIFEAEIGEARLREAGENRDKNFHDNQEAILTQDLTDGERGKVPLVAREQELSKKIQDISSQLNNKQLTQVQRSDLEGQLKAVEAEYDTNKKAIDANAVEHGSWMWGDKTQDELRDLFYERGVSKEGAYTKLKAKREADAYTEAHARKGRAVSEIMHSKGMTEQEATQQWYRDLELENQVIRQNGTERTVSVDINDMSAGSRSTVISYLTNRAGGLNPEEQALLETSKGTTIAGRYIGGEARFDIPVSAFVDGKIESKDYENRITLGMDARDFEGWLDASERWVNDDTWGLSNEDLDKISQYEHEVDENKGKRKAAYDAAYLSFDPASVRKTSSSRGGSVFNDGSGGAYGDGTVIEAVGTALNPQFWDNIIDKGARAIDTKWRDYSEEEAAEASAAFSTAGAHNVARDRLAVMQAAAASMNDEYSEEIASGEMEEFAFSPKQLEVFESTMGESVSDGVGEFVPVLIELAAITAATEGTMTWLGVTRYLNSLKGGYRIVDGITKAKKGRDVMKATMWEKAGYHAAHIAIEEAKMQVAGFDMTSGGAFYVGGQLGGRFLVPSKLLGLAARTGGRRAKIASQFSTFDPLAAKTIGAGVIGSASGELAGVSELAWHSYVGGDGDFKTGFNNLYGDFDDVEKRLITNAFVFGIAGNMGKGRMKKQDFIFSTKGKAAHAKSVNEKMNAKRKQEIRESDSIKEDNNKLDEARAELKELERARQEEMEKTGDVGAEPWMYQRKKNLAEMKIVNLENKIENAVDVTFYQLEKIRFGTDGGKGLGPKAQKVWDGMSEASKSKNLEYEKTQSAVDSWFSWSKMTDKIEPFIWKDGKEIENPEFQKEFNNAFIDPINIMLKASFEASTNNVGAGKFQPLTVEFFNEKQAKRNLGEKMADFNPDTNVLRFNLAEMRGGQGSAYTNHELVHAALSQVFKGEGGKRGKFLFQQDIRSIFEEAFGPEYGKEVAAKVKEKYGNKDLKDGELDRLLQEEYIANLAEFITQPKIYHTKVANTFIKEVGAEFRSIIEENFGGNKILGEALRPKNAKDVVNLLGRMGNDIRGGFSMSQKFKWLTQLDELEDASLLGVEFTHELGSNTVQSKGLTKQLQTNSVALTKAKERGDKMSVKELEATKKEIEASLERHDKTQSTVDKFKEALEANEISVARKLDKLKKDKEGLDKDSMTEEAYNSKVELLDKRHEKDVARAEEGFSAIRDKHIDSILDLQGGYVNTLRAKYNPSINSGFTREMLESGVREHVEKLMRTYDKFKNDSFAPYLKKNLPLRFGEIMKSEGISLDTVIKNKSIEVMYEAGIELEAPAAREFELNQSPGGEGMVNAMKTRLIKSNENGKLEAGEIRLSEDVLLDISNKADKVELDLGSGKRLPYKDAPNIAAKHIEALSVPKAKAAKGQEAYGKDYGSAVQKRANFVANHQEQIAVAGRKNVAVNFKGEGTGKGTGLPKTLQGRKRPGENTHKPVYYQDMIGADGKRVSVKMAKTGLYGKGEKISEGAKTGTYIKEKIEMSREQWLAETGIIDNRTPEQIKKAIRISQKKILIAEDIKFMKESGNVDMSAIQEKIEGKAEFKDPALQTILKQHVGELGQAMSVQAIEARYSSSPEFKVKVDAANLIEAVKSGADPRLAAKGMTKTLSELWSRKDGVKVTEQEAQRVVFAWKNERDGVAQDLTGVNPEHLQYMRDNFDGTPLRKAMLKVQMENVVAAKNSAVIKRFKELELEALINPDYSPAEVAAIKNAMKDVWSTDSGKNVLDVDRVMEHLSLVPIFLSKISGKVPPAILRAMGGDLMQSRTGYNTLVKRFHESMAEQGIELKTGTTKKALKEIEKLNEKVGSKAWDKKVAEINEKYTNYPEAKKIVDQWKNGTLEKGVYKEHLDVPKNQHTDIFKRVTDKEALNYGELVELSYSDPLFKMSESVIEKAGTDVHPGFGKKIDFGAMKSSAQLNAAATKARKLEEQGDKEGADAVMAEAFTKMDKDAKELMYEMTGVIRQELIANAKGKEKQAWINFSYMVAKSNSSLVNGERLFVNNEFFREGITSPERQAMIDYFVENGGSLKNAEKLADKTKVEHALASFQAGTKKAHMEVNGTWAKNAKEFMKDWVGVYGVEGEFYKVDKIGGDTNPTGTDRLSILGEGMKKFYRWDAATGKRSGNMYDYQMEQATKILIDGVPVTKKKLLQPHMRDFTAQYLESAFAGKGGAKKALKKALENEVNHKKVDKNLADAAPKVFNSKGLSRGEKLELMSDIQKATANSRRKAKRKGMSTWDFDDTLARTKSDVLFTAPDGTKGKLNATEFAKEGNKLLEDGYKFDFSEFNKVTEGKPGPFLEKALERAKKFGTKDTFILTARNQAAAPAIKKFLDSQGLKIPMKNIVGLGNSTGASKAQWMVKKFAEGYNDMYFADDAMANVEAVKYVLDRLDTKSEVQLAKTLASAGLTKGINEMIERKSGIGADKIFSGAKGKMLGRKRWSRSLVVPGAQDFMGLMQNFIGKGKQGNADRAFFEQHLGKPFARAHKEMNEARQKASEDMKALYKDVPGIKKKLNKVIPGSAFTYDQAIRSYLWKKAGYEIPELSARDLKDMVDAVENSADLKVFAEGLEKIGKGKWTKPTESWVAETIVSDLFRLNNKERRAEYLEEWQQNIDEIFSKENLNKIEATQGSKFREALEDGIYRMKTGSNRPTGANRLQNTWTNFINGSVGATMFLNMKSALFQTISATNYMNWNFNNPAAAARAFANQKQYWKDFSMLWNSPMLKQRRSGLEYNVQEAELAAALAGQTNKAKAAMAWLIKKGFTPTQIADSFAISSGGAAHYRNNVRRLMKQGKSKAEAEQQAFLEFQELTEVSQQSSRADLISQQQASGLGRTILAWANTPMQYLRIQEKAARDIVNGRGSNKENLGKIAYYGAIQSIVFAGLQNALFAWGLDEDDDMDDEGLTKSLDRTLNTVVDGQLRGFGVGGAVVSALKNTILEFIKQEGKNMPDHKRTTLALLSVSPVLSSKIRKLYSAGDEWNYNRDAISEMGWDIDNPVIHAGANVIEATTNIPVARAVQKVDNLRNAADDNNQWWQRVASATGFAGWSIGIEDTEVEEAKARGKKNRKNTKDDISDKRAEEGYIKDQAKERDRGQQKITCAGVTKNGGRCKTKPIGSGTYCTVHQKVATRESGKKTQCSARKSNGKRCKMQTNNQSGKCYYHD